MTGAREAGQEALGELEGRHVIPHGQALEIDPVELMVHHLDALYTRDDHGRMVAVNESGGGVAPRFFLGRTGQGDVWSLRHDQPESMLTAVASVIDRAATSSAVGTPERLVEIERLLEETGPIERRWSGPAFVVPADIESEGTVVRITADNADLLRPLLSEWIPDVAAGVPMFASIHEGEAVSLCCSVRVTPSAHEAGVETHPDFRGRGHAGPVTVGWARAVREMEAIPLYSTSLENVASRRVAEKLGLKQFGTDVHLT